MPQKRALRVKKTPFSLELPLRTRRACTGVKEGFGVKNSHFPSAPEKGASSQKIPILPVEPCGWGFFHSKALEMGFFDPETLFGDLGPCTGRRRVRKPTPDIEWRLLNP